MREDVTLIEQTGFLSHEIYGIDYLYLPESQHLERQDEIEAKYIYSDRPVYYTVKRDFSAYPDKKIVQEGLVFKVIDKEVEHTPKYYWDSYTFRGADDNSISKDYMTNDVIATYFIRKGEYHFSLNEIEDAIKEFKKASSYAQDNPVVAYNLGNIYLKAKMPEEAITEYHKALKANLFDSKLHNNLGYAYLSNGEITKAKLEYLNAIKIDPTNLRARLNIAGILYQEGNLNDAVMEYNLIIKQDPTYATAYRNLGEILYRAGLKQKAAKVFIDYLELRPNTPETDRLKARIAEGAETT